MSHLYDNLQAVRKEGKIDKQNKMRAHIKMEYIR